MTMPDKVYDVLKWIVILILPASATLYEVLAAQWGLPYAAQIPATILAIQAFLGAALGISTINYNKETKSEE